MRVFRNNKVCLVVAAVPVAHPAPALPPVTQPLPLVALLVVVEHQAEPLPLALEPVPSVLLH